MLQRLVAALLYAPEGLNLAQKSTGLSQLHLSMERSIFKPQDPE